MQFSAAWKSTEQELFYNAPRIVLYVITALLSSHIDDAKFIDSSNNGQHELLGRDCLFGFLMEIMARDAPFHGMIKFQSDKFWKFTFLMDLENGQ
jgi:hypothetical protein